LIAELFHSPEETSPLAVVLLSFSELAKSSPVRLAFTPLTDPPDQSYYLSLKASQGEIRVLGRAEDAYPNGQAYLNGSPVESDLAFRLSCYGLAALAATWSYRAALPALPSLILLRGPLLDRSGLGSRYDLGEKTALRSV
jgi:hypothetical protein